MPPIQARYSYSISDGKDETIAHCDVLNRHGTLWLSNLWVHPEHRKKKYAEAILTCALQDWAHRDLFLEVSPYTDEPLDVPTLTTFYVSFGFHPTSVPNVFLRSSVPFCSRTPKKPAQAALFIREVPADDIQATREAQIANAPDAPPTHLVIDLLTGKPVALETRSEDTTRTVTVFPNVRFGGLPMFMQHLSLETPTDPSD